MSTAHHENHDRLSFDLSDRLAKSLRVSGVSNQEMAATLRVSRNTISNYIHGNTTIPYLALREWALRTGVPFEWLERGVLNEESPSGDDPSGQAVPTTRGGRKKSLLPESNRGPSHYNADTVVPLFGVAA
jgi:transcriptional regulator with XRE-family HTH domain